MGSSIPPSRHSPGTTILWERRGAPAVTWFNDPVQAAWFESHTKRRGQAFRFARTTIVHARRLAQRVMA